MTFLRRAITATLFAAIGMFAGAPLPSIGWAQSQVNSEDTSANLSNEQLDELVGPIALYPDDLLAITLPASTFPLDIVQAARYLEQHKKDPKLKPQESWDSSVLGLLNYPDVVEKMNQNLDWTSQLGDAVVNQQADVMDAVQRFRSQAKAAGNLDSDKHTTVAQEKEVITIVSAEPEVIYVPSYDPTIVIVSQPAPYRYVYSTPYPYYYSPAAAFWTGMFVGSAISYGVGWNGYGHNDININRNVDISGNTINRGSGNKWNSSRKAGSSVSRPASRPGSRPGTGTPYNAKSRVGNTTQRTTSKKTTQKKSSNTGGQARRQQSHSGSFGNYQSGHSTRTQSSRGQRSRSSRSHTRTSKSSHSRSRGGRGRR